MKIYLTNISNFPFPYTPATKSDLSVAGTIIKPV